MIDHGRLPFSTDHIFEYGGGADFSLHNFTPLANLLALPLVEPMGIVGAFNLVLLGLLALAGFGAYLLAVRLGLTGPMAWIAGAVFMASPAITARETAHISLVNAAALPIFVVALLDTLDKRRVMSAVWVGVLVAVASYSDAYYGIYCIAMGAVILAYRFVGVRVERTHTRWPRLARILTGVILAFGALLAWRAATGTTLIVAGPIRIGLQTLYTPLLVLTACVLWRLSLALRPTWHLELPAEPGRLVRLGAVSMVVCLALLLPPLAGIVLRALHDQLPGTTTLWRSSPRGVDLLSYLVPNPNHPWLRAYTQHWLMPTRGDAYPEFVGAFSIVAIVVIAAGAWLGALPRLCVLFTGTFVLLSLGPFIHVGGVNTEVIGPWAVLRYVPVIGMARSPSRFAIVAALGLSLLFAFALRALQQRHAARRWMVPAILAVLALELVPAPRPLHSAGIPEVYQQLARMHDENGALMELPGGIRDGTSSFGDFSSSQLYFQTAHGWPLVGGYLSRISNHRREESRRLPVLRVLFAMSEQQPVPAGWLDDARRSRATFLEGSCVKFVLVDRRRATDQLLTTVVDVLQLKPVYSDSMYTLFRPINPPSCRM